MRPEDSPDSLYGHGPIRSGASLTRAGSGNRRPLTEAAAAHARAAAVALRALDKLVVVLGALAAERAPLAGAAAHVACARGRVGRGEVSARRVLGAAGVGAGAAKVAWMRGHGTAESGPPHGSRLARAQPSKSRAALSHAPV